MSIYKNILLIIIIFLSFTSCTPNTDPTPIIPATQICNKINFDSHENQNSISFTAYSEWEITIDNKTNDNGWYTVSPTKGNAGKQTVLIKVSENNEYNERSILLTLKSGSLSQIVNITQNQKDIITLSTKEIDVEEKGNTINIEIKTNVPYEVIIPESSKNWIKQTIKTRELVTESLFFDIAPNRLYSKREGEIIIKNGEISETVHINQAAAKEVIVQPEAIDLGLSVKWASCNIGASSPENYGGLYGWGDISGKMVSTNDNDYPCEIPPSNICGDTKYDIASKKLGGNWRLPSLMEILELINCKWLLITSNNTNYYKVIGPNGNSILLPIAGYRIGTNIYFEGIEGGYWSGISVHLSNKDNAYALRFLNQNILWGNESRHYGFPIRPVCE